MERVCSWQEERQGIQNTEDWRKYTQSQRIAVVCWEIDPRNIPKGTLHPSNI